MATRSEKWKIKTDPALLCPKLEAIHDLSSNIIAKTYDTIDRLYIDCSKILDKYGIVGSNRTIYRAFMEELYHICNTFTGESRNIQASAIYSKYLFYGCDGNVLIEICKMFNIEMKVSILKTYSKGTLFADGSEQTLLEFIGIGVISGHVDLQNMEDGDVVTIRYYIKLKEGGEYKLYEEETYVGVQGKPVVHFKPVAVDVALKITLQQTAGTYKSFDYNFIREG